MRWRKIQGKSMRRIVFAFGEDVWSFIDAGISGNVTEFPRGRVLSDTRV